MRGDPDPEDVRRRIAAASERRSRHPERREQDAWRLVNGPGDSAPPGLAIDRYAGWLVLSARDHLGDDVVELWAQAALDTLKPEGLVVKRLRRPASRSESRVFAGAREAAAAVRVREDDAVFLVDLDDGTSTGLFLDQHDTRRFIRPLARGEEVLNLFAYTCSFSVHAALAGAARVTSVDVSRRALRRGRENMIASGIDPDRHRWFPDDARAHLGRAARRGDAYGLVLLDPPAFGRAGGRRAMALGKDIEELASLAAAIVRPGGVMLVAVHTAGISLERIRRAIRRPAAEVAEVAELGLPEWDHPTAPETGDASARGLDRGDYLKTLVLRLG